MDGSVSSIAEYVASIGWKALPIAVYAVKPNGMFVDGNRKLCDLLGFSETELTAHNIESFYLKRSDRLDLLAAVNAQRNIGKQTVPFIVKGRQIQVQVFCHVVPNVAAQQPALGYVGALVEVTAESKYNYLLEKHLPAGIYALDADDRVVKANDGFARLHGYANATDVIGMDVKSFYAAPEQERRLKTRLLAEGGVVREVVELRKCDGQTFSAYVTTIAFIQDGDYTGRGGVVEDRTSELETDALLDDIPVGFYSLEYRDGKDLVVRCNRAFAEIHDYPSRDAIIGADIRATHADRDQSLRFLSELERAAAANRPVLGAKLTIRTPQNRLKIVEVNSRAKLRDGRVVGRTGAIRDITEEEALRTQVDSLTNNISVITNDVDAVLHMFRQTLMQLNLSLRAVESVLAGVPEVEGPTPTDAEVEREITGPLHAMLGGITGLIYACRNADIEDDNTLRLGAIAVEMSNYRSIPSPHWRELWLYGAVEVSNIVRRVAPRAIARDTYRPVLAAADSVARIAGLGTLRIARDAILGVDAPVAALRELVTSGTREPEAKELVSLTDVVLDASRNLAPFAGMRRVRIETRILAEFHVLAARGELTRAIGNLLHNAIKYSWQRDDHRTWIDVTIQRENQAVSITIENWGVPVASDEIENGLPFRLGYRGRLSTDRGRVGTGVGLPDSLRVAKEYGGTVYLESRPANVGANPKDYDQPFITTVTLRLPLTAATSRRESRG